MDAWRHFLLKFRSLLTSIISQSLFAVFSFFSLFMCISNFQAASGGGMLIELAANERAVHGDFFNSKKFFLVLVHPRRPRGS